MCCGHSVIIMELTGVYTLPSQGNTDVVSCWLPEGEHAQFRQGWIQSGSRDFSIRDEVCV